MVTTLLRKPPARDAFPQAASPVAIIGLQGEYDIARREELLATLQAIPSCDIAIIDMRQVTHIDATALTCFIQLRKRLRQSGLGIVRIVGLRPSLYRLYQIAYLHRIFEVFESIGDAMGEYGYTVNEQRVNGALPEQRRYPNKTRKHTEVGPAADSSAVQKKGCEYER